ncbi:uncharacterized protein [Ptychodera flava]
MRISGKRRLSRKYINLSAKTNCDDSNPITWLGMKNFSCPGWTTLQESNPDESDEITWLKPDSKSTLKKINGSHRMIEITIIKEDGNFHGHVKIGSMKVTLKELGFVVDPNKASYRDFKTMFDIIGFASQCPGIEVDASAKFSERATAEIWTRTDGTVIHKFRDQACKLFVPYYGICSECSKVRSNVIKRTRKENTPSSIHKNERFMGSKELLEKFEGDIKGKSTTKQKEQRLLERVRSEMVLLDKSDHDYLTTIFASTEEDTLPGHMKVLWKEQKKALRAKSTMKHRWHPIVIHTCLSIYHRSQKANNTIRNGVTLPDISTPEKNGCLQETDACVPQSLKSWKQDELTEHLERWSHDVMNQFTHMSSAISDDDKVNIVNLVCLAEQVYLKTDQSERCRFLMIDLSSATQEEVNGCSMKEICADTEDFELENEISQNIGCVSESSGTQESGPERIYFPQPTELDPEKSSDYDEHSTARDGWSILNGTADLKTEYHNTKVDPNQQNTKIREMAETESMAVGEFDSGEVEFNSEHLRSNGNFYTVGSISSDYERNVIKTESLEVVDDAGSHCTVSHIPGADECNSVIISQPPVEASCLHRNGEKMDAEGHMEYYRVVSEENSSDCPNY